MSDHIDQASSDDDQFPDYRAAEMEEEYFHSLKILKPEEFEKINGSHLQGFIEVSYDKLVEIFGEPMNDGDKSQVEWWIEQSGIIATIYDHSMPEGVASLPVRKIRQWHVGGFDKSAYEMVNSLIKDHHA